MDFQKLDAEETQVHDQLEYEPEAWGVDPESLRGRLHARVRRDLRTFKELAEVKDGLAGVLDERPR